MSPGPGGAWKTTVWLPAGRYEYRFVVDGKWMSQDEVAYMAPYWIDQTEVTNAMFARFVQATGYKTQAEKAGRDAVGWIERNADRPFFLFSRASSLLDG